MQHTWRTCTAPSVCAELMLNACCLSSDISILMRSRSSHSISGNCFNMQFNWPNRQVDFTFLSCLGMLKELTDIWQCCKSNKRLFESPQIQPLSHCPCSRQLNLFMLCVENTQGFLKFRSDLYWFQDPKSLTPGVQVTVWHKN